MLRRSLLFLACLLSSQREFAIAAPVVKGISLYPNWNSQQIELVVDGLDLSGSALFVKAMDSADFSPLTQNLSSAASGTSIMASVDPATLDQLLRRRGRTLKILASRERQKKLAGDSAAVPCEIQPVSLELPIVVRHVDQGSLIHLSCRSLLPGCRVYVGQSGAEGLTYSAKEIGFGSDPRIPHIVRISAASSSDIGSEITVYVPATMNFNSDTAPLELEGATEVTASPEETLPSSVSDDPDGSRPEHASDKPIGQSQLVVFVEGIDGSRSAVYGLSSGQAEPQLLALAEPAPIAVESAVPDVGGLELSEAVTKLKAAGFHARPLDDMLNAVALSREDGRFPLTLVDRQGIAPGTKTFQSTTVLLLCDISSGVGISDASSNQAVGAMPSDLQADTVKGRPQPRESILDLTAPAGIVALPDSTSMDSWFTGGSAGAFASPAGISIKSSEPRQLALDAKLDDDAAKAGALVFRVLLEGGDDSTQRFSTKSPAPAVSTLQADIVRKRLVHEVSKVIARKTPAATAASSQLPVSKEIAAEAAKALAYILGIPIKDKDTERFAKDWDTYCSFHDQLARNDAPRDNGATLLTKFILEWFSTWVRSPPLAVQLKFSDGALDLEPNRNRDQSWLASQASSIAAALGKPGAPPPTSNAGSNTNAMPAGVSTTSSSATIQVPDGNPIEFIRRPPDIVNVPAITRRPVAEAIARITEAGLKVDPNNAKAGSRSVVRSQNPAPGWQRGVDLVRIGIGVPVPNVVGKTLQEAVDVLRADGLDWTLPQRLSGLKNGARTLDKVVGQDPLPFDAENDNVVEPGSLISLDLLTRVPDMVEQSFSNARQLSERSSLRLEAIGGDEQQILQPFDSDVVISQQPKADTYAPYFSTINVDVRMRMPDVTGFDVERAVALLKRHNLTATYDQGNSSTTQYDVVVQQIPARGRRVAHFSTVDLILKIPIPNVTQMTLREARTMLAERDLVASVPNQAARDEDMVFDQRPRPSRSSATSGAGYASHGDTIVLDPIVAEVPNVVGASLEQAQRVLENGGFGISPQPDMIGNDQITTQFPAAGRRWPRGQSIKVSSEVIVPNLIRMPAERLSNEQTLEAYFRLRVQGDSFPRDIVIAQFPNPGTAVRPRSEIVVTFGAQVPQLVRQDLETADQMLRSAGLTRQVASVSSREVEDPGQSGQQIVERQLPQAGSYISHSTPVQLAVVQLSYAERIEVPNLIGQWLNLDFDASQYSRANAVLANLEQRGFRYQIQTIPNPTGSDGWKVARQTPQPGTRVRKDSPPTIVLYVFDEDKTPAAGPNVRF